MLRIHPLSPVKTGYLIEDNGKALNHDHLLFTFTHDLIALCFLSTTPRSRFTSTSKHVNHVYYDTHSSHSLLRTLLEKQVDWEWKCWEKRYECLFTSLTHLLQPSFQTCLVCCCPKALTPIYFQRITCSLLFAFDDEDETWHVCFDTTHVYQDTQREKLIKQRR